MFPYWVLFSIFAGGALAYPAEPRRKVHGGLILSFAALCVALMIGLRYQVGGDWVTYKVIFRNVEYRSFADALWVTDPGYAILNMIAQLLGLGIVFVNLMCGLIFTWGLVTFARREPNPWLVIVTAIPYLIIVVAMGYTRQAVAIGFIFAALTVFETSLTRLVIYLTIAAMFHKSAVLVGALFILTADRKKYTTPTLLIVLAAVLYYTFLDPQVARLTNNYLGQQFNSQGSFIRVLMNIPPAVVFLMFGRRFGFTLRNYKLWRNFALASIAALALYAISPSSTAVDRVSLYLIPLQMVILGRVPLVFSGRSDGTARLLSLLIVVYSATIQFVWLNYADNASFWLPYRFAPLEQIR